MTRKETHTKVDSWLLSDFPYEIDELPTLGTVIPRGYWFAIERTPDDETVIFLMRNEEVFDR